MTYTNTGAGNIKPSFPFGKCVFHGFESMSTNIKTLFPRIILPFGILNLFLYLAVFYVVVQMSSDFLATGIFDDSTFDATNTEVLGLIGKGVGMYGLFLLVSLFLFAVVINAVFRWFFDQNLEGQLGALRFGRDEIRTVLVLFVYNLLTMMAPFFLGMIVLSIGAGVGMASAVVGGLIMGVGVIGIFVGMVYLSVKLSLCVPLSLQRRKFTMFDSLRLTKGRGWSLLGSYTIMWVIYMVAVMLLSVVQNVSLATQISPILRNTITQAGDDTAVMQAILDMLQSPTMFIPLAIFLVLQITVFVTFLFGFTGLTAFSMRFLQEEKSDTLTDLGVFD